MSTRPKRRRSPRHYGQERVFSRLWAQRGLPKVISWDTFPVYPGEAVRLIFESAAPDRRRGVFLMINGELECNGVRSRALNIWADQSPPGVFITCYPIGGQLSLYHILEHAGNRWSQLDTMGMLTEDIPRGRRFCCWDGEYENLHPIFDRLVFTLDRAEPSDFAELPSSPAHAYNSSPETITIGSQHGGTSGRIEGSIDELQTLLRTLCIGPYSPDIDQFCMLFRVDGDIIQWDWNTEGVGRLRRSFKQRCVQIDVGVPYSRTYRVPTPDVRLYLIDCVGQAFQAWVARLQKDKTPIDSIRLFDDYARVRRRYLANTQTVWRSNW